MARFGVLIGAFDPIRRGHIEDARRAVESLALDGAIFAPLADPACAPPAIAPYEDRMNMIAIAIEGERGFALSIPPAGRVGPSDAAGAMDALRRERPDDRFEPIPVEDAPLEGRARWMGDSKGEARSLTGAESEPSPSDPRGRVAAGDVEGEAPARTYIEGQGLYGAPDGPYAVRLRIDLTPSRLAHSRAVASVAVRLAIRWGASPGKAYLAGLLHDCAKGFPPKRAMRLAETAQAPPDDSERAFPQLIHAPAGEAHAREAHGVRDPETLSAIRWHALGDPAMGILERIVYLADYIEPTRRFARKAATERIRSLAESDLNAAVRECARAILDWNAGRPIHPSTARLAELR